MILDSAPSWQPDTCPPAADAFPLRIPAVFLERFAGHDARHPVLRQFLPSADEARRTPGFTRDPVGETGKVALPGLLHKYEGRVLLIVSSHCPVHCRYCFRRHFPYDDNRNGRDDWDAAIDYVRRDPSIREVIYSGGDPLSASDLQLQRLTDALAAIPHVLRLRVHTRFPVVVPSRLTPELPGWLGGTRLQATLVLHCNHPDELSPELAAGLAALRRSGITLLNQSVLLQGVNDNVDTLAALSEALFAIGVLPYYLHRLDPVEGAAHFAVGDDDAHALYRALQARLPGYLVPRLVREEAGQPAKTLDRA